MTQDYKDSRFKNCFVFRIKLFSARISGFQKYFGLLEVVLPKFGQTLEKRNLGSLLIESRNLKGTYLEVPVTS